MPRFAVVRVLCIDGGGIRGLIPALVLAEMERRTGRRVANLFDLIAGTSTGAILAAGLTRPGADGTPAFTAAELAERYEADGPRIFDRSWVRVVFSAGGVLDEKYASDGLLHALERSLHQTPLSETVTPILLCSYEIERRKAFFFRTSRAREHPDDDFTLIDAVHASCAAPTYFEPARVTDRAGTDTYSLIDGGVFASNPSACALAELGGARPEWLVSLGTGVATRPIPYERARHWGQLGWARSVIDVLLSGQAEVVDFQLGRLLGERYVRLQTRLDTASDALDNTSPSNLHALRTDAARLLRERSDDIDALCAALTRRL